MTNKLLDEIIDLFCVVVGDSNFKDNSVYGRYTELFETRQKARDKLLDIFYRNGIKHNDK